MIKLKIRNQLDYCDGKPLGKPNQNDCVYDREALRDGKVYCFDHLIDIKRFIDKNVPVFTQEFTKRQSRWDWWEIYLDIEISDDEEDTLIYSIDYDWESRD